MALTHTEVLNARKRETPYKLSDGDNLYLHVQTPGRGHAINSNADCMLAVVCVAIKARCITHSTCTATAIIDHPICHRIAMAAYEDNRHCRTRRVEFLHTTEALGANWNAKRGPPTDVQTIAKSCGARARIGLHLRRTGNTKATSVLETYARLESAFC
jgi:hypothetical protein